MNQALTAFVLMFYDFEQGAAKFEKTLRARLTCQVQNLSPKKHFSRPSSPKKYRTLEQLLLL